MLLARDVKFGINIHDQDDVQAVAAMKTLGFTRYRKDATGATAMCAALSAAGFKGCHIVTDGPQSSGGQLDLLRPLETASPGTVEFVESRNEINNRATVYGGFTDTGGFDQSNRSAVELYDEDLYADVKADAVLGKAQVICHTNIHSTRGMADFANAHAYDGDTDSFPDYWPAQVSKEMTAVMPGKPQAMTEFGSKTTDRQARLLPQWIAASLQAGINPFYLYELRDQPGDPYGLFNADWTPKPAVPVIAQLVRLLTDTGAAFIPAPLNVATSDAGVNSVLIAKSDGSYVHLLWRSWPDGTKHPFTWSYDRAMHIQSHGINGQLSELGWAKAAGVASDWLSYVEGVLVLELSPR